MKTLTPGAERRLPLICEEEQPQEDSRLENGIAHQRRGLPKRDYGLAALCRRITRSRIPLGVQENQAMLSVNEVIARDPEVLGGTPVFRGTRVPFQALLDYLEGGQTLGEFLDDFPTVTRDAAVSALEQGKLLLVSQLG